MAAVLVKRSILLTEGFIRKRKRFVSLNNKTNKAFLSISFVLHLTTRCCYQNQNVRKSSKSVVKVHQKTIFKSVSLLIYCLNLLILFNIQLRQEQQVRYNSLILMLPFSISRNLIVG